MFERFTEKALQVIMLAQEESRRLGHNFVGSEQILLGLIGEKSGIAYKALKDVGVNLKDARLEVERIIGRGTGFISVEIPFTPQAKKVLERSVTKSKEYDHNYISTEHLLLSLIHDNNGVGCQVLRNLEVDFHDLYEKVGDYMQDAALDKLQEEAFDEEDDELDGSKVLDECTSNLTVAATKGTLDPVIARDKEIDRVIQILSRRR